MAVHHCFKTGSVFEVIKKKKLRWGVQTFTGKKNPNPFVVCLRVVFIGVDDVF